MNNTLLYDLHKKLFPEKKISRDNLKNKDQVKGISREIVSSLKDTNQKLNAFSDIIKKMLVKNNPNKKDFINLVESASKVSNNKVNETYNKVNELHIVLNNLSKYVRDNLKEDLNKILSENENADISGAVRRALWDGPKFNNTERSLGLVLRDLVSEITNNYKSSTLKENLDYNRQLLSKNQKQFQQERQNTESEIQGLKDKNSNLQSNLEDLEKKYNDINDRRVEIERNESDLRVQISQLEKQLATTNKQKADLNSQVTNYGQDNSRIENQKADLSRNISVLENELRQLRDQVLKLEEEKSKIFNQNQELTQRQQNIIDEKSDLSKNIVETNREQIEQIKTLEDKVRDYEVLKGNMERDINDVRGELSRLTQVSEKDTFEDLLKILQKLGGILTSNQKVILAETMWKAQPISNATQATSVPVTATSVPSTRTSVPVTATSVPSTRVQSKQRLDTSSPKQRTSTRVQRKETSSPKVQGLDTSSPKQRTITSSTRVQRKETSRQKVQGLDTSSPKTRTSTIVQSKETSSPKPRTSTRVQRKETSRQNVQGLDTSSPKLRKDDKENELKNAKKNAFLENRKQFLENKSDLKKRQDKLIKKGKFKDSEGVREALETQKLEAQTNDLLIKNASTVPEVQAIEYQINGSQSTIQPRKKVNEKSTTPPKKPKTPFPTQKNKESTIQPTTSLPKKSSGVKVRGKNELDKLKEERERRMRELGF